MPLLFRSEIAPGAPAEDADADANCSDGVTRRAAATKSAGGVGSQATRASDRSVGATRRGCNPTAAAAGGFGVGAGAGTGAVVMAMAVVRGGAAVGTPRALLATSMAA